MTRLFAPSASWNRKAAELGEAARPGNYAWRFLEHAWGPEPSARRKFQPKVGDYAVTFLDAADATTKVKVAQSVFSQKHQTLGNVAVGTEIPWNPEWARVEAAVPIWEPNYLPYGSDRCVVIIDYDTGEAWYLWGAAEPHGNCVDWFWIFKAFGGPNGRAGFKAGSKDWIGVGTCHRQPNIYAATDAPKPADWPKTIPWRGTVPARGAKFDKAALVVRVEEIEQGVIDHALSASISNPMYGPIASPPNSDLDLQAGITKSFYVPPATDAEYRDDHLPPVGQDGTNRLPIPHTIPSGRRYALRITDAAIEAWLDSRRFTGKTRRLARIFAVALRDYGWIVAETGGWGVGIECESARIPEVAARWREQGVAVSPSTAGTPLGDLLDGIFDFGETYVVAVPG